MEAAEKRTNRAPLIFSKSHILSHVVPAEYFFVFRVVPTTQWVSTVIIIAPLLCTHLHLYLSLTRRTNGRNLGTFQNQCSFESLKAVGRKVLSFVFSLRQRTCVSGGRSVAASSEHCDGASVRSQTR